MWYFKNHAFLLADHPKLQKAENLEEVICLATLIATGQLDAQATLEDSRRYYKELGCCEDCINFGKCLACVINE